MRESSLVPTNLLNWPRVAGRLPEEKLILLALWSSPALSCAGAGFLAIRPFAATCGLAVEACETGIMNLVEAGLIIFDDQTSEVFILDWFRFHKFKTPQSLNILAGEVAKVQSEALKNVIREKSSTCLPTATATATATLTSTPNPPPPPSGVPPKGAGAVGSSTIRNQKRLGKEEEQNLKTVDLPGWLDVEEWNTFKKHRRALRKPFRGETEMLAVAELTRLREAGHTPSKVIQQSIVSGWSGLFPLRGGCAVSDSRQKVRDVLSGLNHDLSKKDYAAGIDADGRPID